MIFGIIVDVHRISIAALAVYLSCDCADILLTDKISIFPG